MKTATELINDAKNAQEDIRQEAIKKKEDAIKRLEEYLSKYLAVNYSYGYLDINSVIVNDIGLDECKELLLKAGFNVEARHYLFDSHPLTVVWHEGCNPGFTDKKRPKIKEKTFIEKLKSWW